MCLNWWNTFSDLSLFVFQGCVCVGGGGGGAGGGGVGGQTAGQGVCGGGGVQATQTRVSYTHPFLSEER